MYAAPITAFVKLYKWDFSDSFLNILLSYTNFLDNFLNICLSYKLFRQFSKSIYVFYTNFSDCFLSLYMCSTQTFQFSLENFVLKIRRKAEQTPIECGLCLKVIVENMESPKHKI